MEKTTKTLDLTTFWESAAKRNAEEREDERRHIEAVLNQALAGVSAVAWEGMAIRGVRRINVGNALELAFLDENGDVIVESGELPTCDRLYLRTWPDGLLEISTDEEDDA